MASEGRCGILQQHASLLQVATAGATRGKNGMNERDQAALARFRLQLARQAFTRGAIPEARRALLNLTASDFAAGSSVCGELLAVLGNHRASDQEVRDAIRLLVSLRPRGAP